MNYATRSRTPLLLAAGALAVAGAVGGCGSDEDPVENLVIEDVWAPPTEAGDDVELRLTVRSPAGDTIAGASVPGSVAASTTLRSIGGGSTDMIDLPDGETIIIGPDSFGIVLTGVAEALAAGDRFELTLELTGAGDQFVPVVVGDGPPFD